MKNTKSLLAMLIALIGLTGCSAQLVNVPLKSTTQEELQRSSDLRDRVRFLPSTNYPLNLVNEKKLYYYGDVKLGNTSQAYSMIFDTTTSTNWIPNPQCIKNKACDGFDRSYTCTNDAFCFQTQILENNFSYGGNGTLSGIYQNVSVSVAGLSPVNITVLSANKIDNLSFLEADGVFGLQMYDGYGYNGNSYLSYLYNTGKIQVRAFSLYFGFKRDDSLLTFGGYDPSKLANQTNISFHDVKMNLKRDSSQKWVIPAASLSFDKYNTTFAKNKNLVLLSSIDSDLRFSSDIFPNMINSLIDSRNVTKKDNRYYVNCTQEMPDIVFIFPDCKDKNITYSLSPSFYINNLTTSCELMISDMSIVSDTKMILGTAFIRKYVSFFSMSNNTIGFSESIAKPDDDYTKLPAWVYVVIALASVAVAALVGGGIYLKKYKDKKKSEKLSYNLMDNNGTSTSLKPSTIN